ncbi:MAG TPA: glycosyltransferase family 9 protein [Bacteroidales bacterium]|nr:glycosyltransferase family 9 protein [Bacteroidales bacterium]
MPKILIIRFSSIGDVVLTTPVIRCIAGQLAGAEIHYLTKEQYLPLLAGNPYIRKIITIRRDVEEVLPQLRKERYDFVVDLHHNLRSLVTRMALLRPSGTFPKKNIRKWILVHWKIDRMPSVHIVERYFRAVRKLHVTYDGQGLDYFIPDAGMMDIESLPPSHQQGYIAFIIGARHQTKILPAEKIIRLCRKLGQPVVLLGGPEDQARGEAIAREAGSLVYSACGLLDINQSASLVARASMVITHDTGLMHIAAAFRKRIISVWGNTVPALGMYPYYPDGYSYLSSIQEVKGLNCRPCSKLGYPSCPRKHFRCMNDMDEDAIVGLASS